MEFVREVRSIHIYNRWGHRVFSNEGFTVNDPTAGWDGRTAGGDEHPGGVYVYVTEVELYDGEIQLLRGNFTLVR